MTVFDLPGPEFLQFYWVLGAALTGVVLLVQWWVESGPVPRIKGDDPYLVAYVRGGPREAVRVAVLSLLDRQLLEVDNKIVVAAGGAPERVQHPLEHAVLAGAGSWSPAASVHNTRSVGEATAALGAEVRRLGLMPSKRQFAMRAALGLVAVVILWVIALHKIDLAAQRGRTNVGFLFLSPFAFLVVHGIIFFRPRTSIGTRYLRDMRRLLGGVAEQRSVLTPGGSEVPLVAAVFGIAAVRHVGAWSNADVLFRRDLGIVKGSQSSTGSSSCGSSSCGSSCGGGGCGGGCGGCGS
jgi:uncharacterized protein (TIGR04222 family)